MNPARPSLSKIFRFLRRADGSDNALGATPAHAARAASAWRPQAPDPDAAALGAGNTAFAADLYGALRNQPEFAKKNLCFSPYSISAALAMAYAGARGATARALEQTLHFTLPDGRLHAAFHACGLALASRQSTQEGQAPLTLRIANALWGDPQTKFEPPFLDTLAAHYGAGVLPADFSAPEAACAAVNNWVAGQTCGKIQNLLSPRAINSLTSLILVNAVYFRGRWSAPFQPEATAAGTFHGANGDMTAPMMQQTHWLPYGAGQGWRAVQLRYDGGQIAFGGGVTFTAILPDDLAAFEAALNAATLAAIDRALGSTLVTLALPRFKIEGVSFSLKQALQTLGAAAVFDRDQADLTGIANLRPLENLFVSDVVHQSFISVDEKGTEAAAATATRAEASASAQPPQPIVLTFDRPFVFLLRDAATGAVLFLGRYVGG
jgi:serpin B